MKEKISAFFTSHPKLSIACTCIVFIGIQSFFSFCTKVKCPGFASQHFDAWFPYKQGQILIFESPQIKNDTITIGRITKDPPYTATRGWGFSGCSATGTIYSNEMTAFSSLLYVSASTHEKGVVGNITVIVKGFQAGGRALGDSGIVVAFPQMIQSTYFSSYSLGSKTFSKVQQLTRDTAVIKTIGVYRVWLAKDIGLIGYEEYPSKNLYIKQ